MSIYCIFIQLYEKPLRFIIFYDGVHSILNSQTSCLNNLIGKQSVCRHRKASPNETVLNWGMPQLQWLIFITTIHRFYL